VPPVGVQDDGAVAIGAVEARPGGRQAPQRLSRRVTEGVARPHRDDGDRRPGGLEERAPRPEAAAVVGDLEDIDAPQGLTLRTKGETFCG